MKRPVQKNLVVSTLDILDNTLIQPTIAMLVEIAKNDENARFKIINGNDSAALLTVDYVDYEEAKPKNAGILANCNSDYIKDETICGCFACLSIFKGNEIQSWNPMCCDCLSAVCPVCNSETVIPNLDEALFLVEAQKIYPGGERK